jgi:hypothetical protein
MRADHNTLTPALSLREREYLFASKPGAVQQELRQHGHRTTGCAFGFTGTPRGTGDVQMRPVVLTGKARQGSTLR